MPQQLCDDLLDNFEEIIQRPIYSKLLKKAQHVFEKLVSQASGVDASNRSYARVLRGYKSEKGKTLSSDIHTDPKGTGPSKKYIMTITNNQRGGTLFFPNNDEILEAVHTEGLFRRTRCGHLVVREDVDMEFAWEQAQSGQLVSFVPQQFHAAAPLYAGDQKFLLSAWVRD